MVIKHGRFLYHNAPIAQLDRVLDYESKGCKFDSCWAHVHFRNFYPINLIHNDVCTNGLRLALQNCPCPVPRSPISRPSLYL